jgi:hypothetical protein
MSSKDSREFNPTEHFIKFQGRDYLPVTARLAWLVSAYPSYSITTLVDTDVKPPRATAHVRIYKDDGTLLREATAIKVGAGAGAANTPMGVETGAVGRALGMLGFGTMQAGEDFEEDGEVMGGIADSPVERKAPPVASRAALSGLTPASKIGAPKPAPAAPAAGGLAPYDHDSLADDDVLSAPKVKRIFAIGSKLFPDLKGDALEKRLLKAASAIVKADVLNLHRLQWRDGNDVMKKLEEEAVSRGVWGEAK